jgi:hypothetical protein
VIASLFLFFTCFGIFSLGWSSHLISSDYESELNIADSSAEEADAAKAYERAILIDPERVEAYGLDLDKTGRETSQNFFSALSGEFNGDEYIFDKDEEKELQSLLTNVELKEDLVTIWKSRGYLSQLAYRIGNIYWKYYIKESDSGDPDENNQRWIASEIDRQIKAMKWFDYVVKDKDDKRLTEEEHNLAQAYYDIGTFTKQRLNDKDQAAFDPEEFKEHFNQLNDTFALLAQSDDKQAKLSLDSIILGDVSYYLIDYHDADIAKSDLEALINKVQKDIQSVDIAKSQTGMGELKERLLNDTVPLALSEVKTEYGKGTERYEPTE